MSEIPNNALNSPIPSPQSQPNNLILSFIQSLNDNQKRLFYKVMRREFDKLMPLKSLDQFNNLVCTYWMLETVRKRHNLRSASLSLLTLIYYATNQGRQAIAIKTLLPYSPDSSSFIRNSLVLLYKLNYIRSGIKDNSHVTRYSKYINLTPEALAMMQTILRELRDLIYKTHIIIEPPPKR